MKQFLFRHHAFGLSIASDIHLPAPTPDSKTRPDLVIRQGPLLSTLARSPRRISDLLQIDCVAADHWILFANGLDPAERFSASVRPGSIEVGFNAGVHVADVAVHLLGIGIAAHAYVSARACLHASCIRMADQAVILLGDSGRGKSTLSAALIAAGGQLVSEEIVLLGDDPREVVPGIPTIKITQDVANLLGLGGDTLPAFKHKNYGHEGVRVGLTQDQFAGHDLAQVSAIYLLGERHLGLAPILSPPLPIGEAAATLVEAAYWAPNLPQRYRALMMRTALRMALDTPMYLLQLPDNLDSLPEAISLLHAQVCEMEFGV